VFGANKKLLKGQMIGFSDFSAKQIGSPIFIVGDLVRSLTQTCGIVLKTVRTPSARVLPTPLLVNINTTLQTGEVTEITPSHSRSRWYCRFWAE
jgi:hypothetical protein